MRSEPTRSVGTIRAAQIEQRRWRDDVSEFRVRVEHLRAILARYGLTELVLEDRRVHHRLRGEVVVQVEVGLRSSERPTRRGRRERLQFLARIQVVVAIFRRVVATTTGRRCARAGACRRSRWMFGARSWRIENRNFGSSICTQAAWNRPSSSVVVAAGVAPGAVTEFDGDGVVAKRVEETARRTPAIRGLQWNPGGNCASTAPSLPPAAIGSMPALNRSASPGAGRGMAEADRAVPVGRRPPPDRRDVGERLIELDRELEARRRLRDPPGGRASARLAVEGRVHLDGVEVLGVERQLVGRRGSPWRRAAGRRRRSTSPARRGSSSRTFRYGHWHLRSAMRSATGS